MKHLDDNKSKTPQLFFAEKMFNLKQNFIVLGLFSECEKSIFVL